LTQINFQQSKKISSVLLPLINRISFPEYRTGLRTYVSTLLAAVHVVRIH